MMTYSIDVEVLSITHATDVITGDLLYQVGFGRTGKPAKGLSMPPQITKVASNSLIIYMPQEKECPYRAGSKWILKIDEDGTLSLEKKE
jgi:hypothetical protein